MSFPLGPEGLGQGSPVAFDKLRLSGVVDRRSAGDGSGQGDRNPQDTVDLFNFVTLHRWPGGTGNWPNRRGRPICAA